MQIMDTEKDIQKKVMSLCIQLPIHVATWKTVLDNIQSPLKTLVNYGEQLRFVEQARIGNDMMDNFSLVQMELQLKILGQIEEELVSIKSYIKKLNETNHDLKNKLANLERATIELDWDSHCSLIQGTPLQPPLRKLLQMAYEFWIYFSNVLRNINSKTKSLRDVDFRHEKSVEEFQKCFALSLNCLDKHKQIYSLLALTQYIGNEKLVT